jgi:RNA polymerase sigma-70 factor, ECF subfamily
VEAARTAPSPTPADLEQHRAALTGYCYRMLGSPFEAEDAVQETLLRAWRSLDRFEGRSSLRSWLYRIATNVCMDALGGRERRPTPIDLGPAGWDGASVPEPNPDIPWLEPIPDVLVAGAGDPADQAVGRETIRLAFVAALQSLPPRQRAVLILCEVLHFRAAEVADLLETTVASVNSALQRARATVEAKADVNAPALPLGDADRELLDRYVDAFERYDMEALTALIREDATQTMPPYELWLSGREEILCFWQGPGAGCRGSRVLPAPDANGRPTFAQYKPSETGSGWEPWALQVLELADGRVADLRFFLDCERVFPLFGLPLRLDA